MADLLTPLDFVGDALGVAVFDDKADAVTVVDNEEIELVVDEMDTELESPADFEYDRADDGDCVTKDDRDADGDPDRLEVTLNDGINIERVGAFEGEIEEEPLSETERICVKVKKEEGLDERVIEAPVDAVGHGEVDFVVNAVVVNVPDVVIVTEIVFDIVKNGEDESTADTDEVTESLVLTVAEKLFADEGEIEDETETDCDNLGDEVDETENVGFEDTLTEFVESPDTFGDSDSLGLTVDETDICIDREADGDPVVSLDERLEEVATRDGIGNIEGVTRFVTVRVVIPL